MTARPLETFLRHLGRALESAEATGQGDDQLLERFVRGRDEVAFEVLVCRHGPLVLGLCRRVLRDEQEAEDAFQTTFLTLARKAGSIGRREALGSWLYKVAHRIALRGRGRALSVARSHEVEQLQAPPQPEPGAVEWCAVLDEEVSRLPAPYRGAVVLCYLQGQTHEAAARQLGCAPGTISWRLAWARQRLHTALARRGLGTLTGGLGQLARIEPPQALVEETVRGVLALASNHASSAVVSALVAGAWRIMQSKANVAAGLLLAATLCGAGLMAWPAPPTQTAAPALPQLVANGTAIHLPRQEATRLGVRVTAARVRQGLPRQLELAGSLAIRTDSLVRLRGFMGEVVEIAEAKPKRALTVGDRVEKGQLLAVLSNQDVAARKAALLAGLVRLQLVETTQARLEKGYREGTVPELTVLKGRRDVLTARNAIARERNTLRVWRVPEEEIEAVKKEMQRTVVAGPKQPRPDSRRWGRVEVRAPRDGVIIEKNVVIHEMVDRNATLFAVADLRKLVVLVSVPESNLRALLRLQARHRPKPIPWQVRLVAHQDEDLLESNGLDRIGMVLDPQRHTVPASGLVDNAAGELRAGQMVKVTIALPAPVEEIEVPTSALVEAGGARFVFVQPDPKKLVFSPRRVVVVRRGRDVAHVRASPTPRQKQAGAEALQPGERVVTAGAVELQAALDDLRGEKPLP